MLEAAELVLLKGLKNRKHWATVLPLLNQRSFACDKDAQEYFDCLQKQLSFKGGRELLSCTGTFLRKLGKYILSITFGNWGSYLHLCINQQKSRWMWDAGLGV